MKNILSDAAIAQLIEEDVPYFDLTTFGLGIGKLPGAIEFYSRHPMVICGTEEATKVFEQCGASVQVQIESSTTLVADQLILKALGSAEALHSAWRIALNLMEYASGPHSALSTGTSGINDEVTELSEALARELSQQLASILNYAPIVYMN
jgi:molybdenum transport protein